MFDQIILWRAIALPSMLGLFALRAMATPKMRAGNTWGLLPFGPIVLTGVTGATIDKPGMAIVLMIIATLSAVIAYLAMA